MALVDPNIAMSYRGVEIPNQLAQYGQLAQIQNAQNQNSLAQYQLGAAQRAEAKDISRINALSKAGTDDTAIANALLQSGDIKGYQEFAKSRRETQKADVDLVDAKLKQSRSFLDTINPADPNAPAQYIAWHEANHKDPVLGPVLAARGVTADQSRERIVAAIQKGPAEFAKLLNQSKLGSEKFIELNKPQLSTTDLGGQVVSRTFQPLTGELNTVGTQSKTPTIADNLAASKFAFEKANPGYEVKEGEDGTMYGVNKRTLQAVPITIGAAAPAGGAPVAGASAGAAPAGGAVPFKGKGTALTESQGNATAYGMRMKEANAILEDLSKKGVLKGAVVESTPLVGGVLGRALPSALGGTSEAQQQVNQAKANFITAVLRKESGAVISDSEFDRENEKYFPQINDNDAVIKQKANARKTAIRAMEIQAGPGAKQMGGAGGLSGANPNDPLGLGIGGR
jgi:hypothetical protein